MARPWRLDLAGTWYHVMNRGHRGGTLYRTDADRRRFLGSVGELPERFGLEIHAFILLIQRRLQQLAGAWQLRRKLGWEAVVKAAEKLRGARWDDWRERHGRIRLTEVVRAVKGIRYQAAAQAVKRFATSLEKGAARQKFVLEPQRQLSLI